jgi:hypothetical protein
MGRAGSRRDSDQPHELDGSIRAGSQQKKLSQAEADREIEVMSSIVDVFAKCRELEESGRERLRR